MAGIEFKRRTSKHKYFHGIDLKKPGEGEFEKYIDIWKSKYNKEFAPSLDHEKLLNAVFKNCNYSDKVVNEYAKCVMLDKLYSTNIKYMDNLVNHLVSIDNLNEMLNNGDAELVNKIKKVEKNNGETINYISFASKYCNRCNPEKYPVYDTIVKDVLSYYFFNLPFYKRADKDKVDFNNYEFFKNVADKFLEEYPFIKNYTQLDNFLWTMGKEKIQGINLVKKIRNNASDILQLQAIAKELNCENELTAEGLEKFIVNQYELDSHE